MNIQIEKLLQGVDTNVKTNFEIIDHYVKTNFEIIDHSITVLYANNYISDTVMTKAARKLAADIEVYKKTVVQFKTPYFMKGGK